MKMKKMGKREYYGGNILVIFKGESDTSRRQDRIDTVKSAVSFNGEFGLPFQLS